MSWLLQKLTPSMSVKKYKYWSNRPKRSFPGSHILLIINNFPERFVSKLLKTCIGIFSIPQNFQTCANGAKCQQLLDQICRYRVSSYTWPAALNRRYRSQHVFGKYSQVAVFKVKYVNENGNKNIYETIFEWKFLSSFTSRKTKQKISHFQNWEFNIF